MQNPLLIASRVYCSNLILEETSRTDASVLTSNGVDEDSEFMQINRHTTSLSLPHV